MRNSRRQIKEFLSNAPKGHQRHVSDYQLAKANNFRHIRSGVVPADASKEANRVPVDAMYIDDLFNVVALCKDGYIRQYIG